jgi:hypothetical protein
LSTETLRLLTGGGKATPEVRSGTSDSMHIACDLSCCGTCANAN